MNSLLRLLMAVLFFIVVYFFSHQIQRFLAKVTKYISIKIGTFSVEKEYAIQRYVFINRRSLVSKFYSWVNEQVISLGLKRYGVTPVGYVCFWGIMNVPITLVVCTLLAMHLSDLIWLYFVLYAVIMLLTRVYVAERMQRREADIMDAIDLVIPDISNGVKVAIIRYTPNFAPTIRPDFEAFVSNLNDRGFTFEEAMYMLSDHLGSVFKDFAQKAIFFENLGEPDMVDIFADIVETNRLRRRLRYENDIAFGELRNAFTISTVITAGYGVFVMTTDDFSRGFFLQNELGKFLLILMVLVVIAVLGYITTIKSKAI